MKMRSLMKLELLFELVPYLHRHSAKSGRKILSSNKLHVWGIRTVVALALCGSGSVRTVLQSFIFKKIYSKPGKTYPVTSKTLYKCTTLCCLEDVITYQLKFQFKPHFIWLKCIQSLTRISNFMMTKLI